MLFFSLGKQFIRCGICALTLALFSQASLAQNFIGPNGEEDTILIEKEVSTKIPYHLLLKKLSSRMLQFDADALVTFGKGRTDHIVRSFSDVAERVKTRVNVDRDEVELKFSLNF